MKIHYFQHVPFESLGSIEDWALARGHRLSSTRFFADDPLPRIEEIDWLIVMGGPMDIYATDSYTWLTREKRFIELAIENNKMVLGICLGAQLIADALGARVYRNVSKEIGWFPIAFTPEARPSPLFRFLPAHLTVLHWHGDTFELPHGAMRIASSEACENQGFVRGNKLVGLQFHLEFTKRSLEQLIENCADELVPGKYVQPAEKMLSTDDYFEQNNRAMQNKGLGLSPPSQPSPVNGRRSRDLPPWAANGVMGAFAALSRMVFKPTRLESLFT